MLCQNCGKIDATTHYHSVINGVVKDKYLCYECAVEEKQSGLKENDIFKILTSFLNDGAVPNSQTVKIDRKGNVIK